MLSSKTIWRKVMTKKTRRWYTAEFKAAAVARLDETGETLSSVAQALGMAATQVKTWRMRHLPRECRRRHSGVGYRTPAQAHAEMLMKAAA
jgi:transposase-like protein